MKIVDYPAFHLTNGAKFTYRGEPYQALEDARGLFATRIRVLDIVRARETELVIPDDHRVEVEY